MTDILIRGPEFSDAAREREAFLRYAHLPEVEVLQSQGIDARVVDVPDPHALSNEKQKMVDDEVGRLESSGTDFTGILFDAETHPSGARWLPLNKRAIALHTLYNASTINTLGDGIDVGAYDVPLFEGKSARELVHEKYDKKGDPTTARKIMGSYDEFVPALLEPDQEGWLSSRDYFRGVKDAIAVRRRAISAMDLAVEHVMGSPLAEREVTSLSLACGAAQPIYDLDKRLISARGVGLERTVLVDNDVTALASAWSIAEKHGDLDKIQIQRQDLIRQDLIDGIEPHSADIVDLLGIFEYIPRNVKLKGGINYRAAEQLLAEVRNVVRPGGMIIFGNMLTQRPQQEFFNQVWPKLEQRTMSEVLDIVEGAGYSRDDVVVKVPSEDAIYAVYGIKIPEGDPLPARPPRQRIARWMVKNLSK